jgi:hypothetical protein
MGCNNSKSLQNAVRRGEADKVRELLESTNCNPSWKNPGHMAKGFQGTENTALHVLCTFGKRIPDAKRMQICRELVHAGADLDARNGLGATPLMTACAAGLADVATYLIRSGASKGMKNPTGATADGYCNAGDDADCIGALRETEFVQGYPTDFRVPDGWKEVWPPGGARPYFESAGGTRQFAVPGARIGGDGGAKAHLPKAQLPREAKKTA